MTPNLSALSIADVLEAAAALIEPEGAWTQGWSARTSGKSPTYALSSAAVCWCMGGAIVKAAGADDDTAALAFVALTEALDVSVATFNDAPERTQAEVVAKLKEAASLAREQSA